MSEVFLSLKGGLGNRLFIISGAVQLRKIGMPVTLAIESSRTLTSLENNLLTALGLDLTELSPASSLRRMIDSPISPIRSLSLGRWHHELVVGEFQLRTLMERPISGIDAYFQSKSWAIEPGQLLASATDLFEEAKTAVQGTGFKRAVHVRRGDYLHFPHLYGVITASDYKAMASERNFNWSDTVVFSDDEELVQHEFAQLGIHINCSSAIFSQKSASHTLALMSSFDSLVMSNSTLSWWAGWIGSSSVLCPDKWGRPHNSPQDLILNYWETFRHPSFI